MTYDHRVRHADWAVSLCHDYAVAAGLGTAAPRLSYDHHYPKSESEEEAEEFGSDLKVEVVEFYPYLSRRTGHTSIAFNVMDKHIDFARRWDCGIRVGGTDMSFAFVPRIRRPGEEPTSWADIVLSDALRRVDSGEYSAEQALAFLRGEVEGESEDVKP